MTRGTAYNSRSRNWLVAVVLLFSFAFLSNLNLLCGPTSEPYGVGIPGEARTRVDHDGLAGFLDMSLFAAKGLPKYSKVPGLESLTFYMWEVDPKPIIMLENSHLKWYESPSEKRLVGLQRYLMTKRFVPADGGELGRRRQGWGG